jgi:hypothetical protein
LLLDYSRKRPIIALMNEKLLRRRPAIKPTFGRGVISQSCEQLQRNGRQQDIAFQRAMMKAALAGREKPPMIGVFKDSRPLDVPRLFVPVERTSGCTSPALVCAELNAEANAQEVEGSAPQDHPVS